MASNHYFEFLGTAWSQLKDNDKRRLSELWHGYEQVIASVYQKFAENSINVAIKDLLPFNTERWLPYDFNSSNKQQQSAVFTSTQDLSLGINLSTKYLLKISVDGKSPIEVDIRGDDPSKTYIPEIVEKINAAFLFKFARGVFEGTVLQLASQKIGDGSSIEILETSDPAKNASEFVLGLIGEDLPAQYPKFPHTYTLPYDQIASIPKLRDSVRDENLEVELVEGVDYIVENFITISFTAPPPEKMWAKRTLFDEETPFNNYGFLMDIYQPTSQRYVEVLQGLWFAFWTGPRPSNVRISLYLLFGLPTAREAGIVTDVTVDSISVSYETLGDQTFEIPSGLEAIVSEGDTLTKFQPLVSGIEVFDKINKPGFIEDEIGRDGIARFLTEDASKGSGDTDETKALRMLEEYTFLPQISVDSFISPDIDLSNVKTFLDAIKPLNKTYLFQVIVGNFRDELGIADRHAQHLDIDVSPSVDSNETTYQSQSILDDYEGSDEPGLDMDPEGILFQEKVDIEVYSFGSLIDSFTI